MKGLLEKDFRLLLLQKRMFLIALVTYIVFKFQTDSGSFASTYFLMLSAMLSISSISYDEANNGYAFLMTMPFTRKMYVAEKYLFSFLCLIVSIMITVILAPISALLFPSTEFSLLQELLISLIFGGVFLLLVSVLIPIRLRFGVEKSQLVTLLTAVCFAGAFVSSVVLLKDSDAQAFLHCIQSVSSRYRFLLPAAGAVAALLFLYASYRISVWIMQKKEF